MKRVTILVVVAITVVLVAVLWRWRARDQQEVIVVTTEVVEQLVAERKSLRWGEVTDTQRDNLIAEYVRKEIIRRIAWEHGIEVETINDPIRNLVLDEILSRSGEKIEPSSDDLIAYYNDHQNRYRQFDAGKVLADMVADQRNRKWEELRGRYRVEYADGVPVPSRDAGEH